MKINLDDIDLCIIRELRNNGRLSYRCLSEQFSLSISSVYSRIKKMEECGIIRRYTVDIDYNKLGYPIHAFVLVKNDKIRDSYPHFPSEYENIVDCWMISGEHDFLIELYVNDNEEFEKIMLYLYKNIGRTRSLISLKDMFKLN